MSNTNNKLNLHNQIYIFCRIPPYLLDIIVGMLFLINFFYDYYIILFIVYGYISILFVYNILVNLYCECEEEIYLDYNKKNIHDIITGSIFNEEISFILQKIYLYMIKDNKLTVYDITTNNPIIKTILYVGFKLGLTTKIYKNYIKLIYNNNISLLEFEENTLSNNDFEKNICFDILYELKYDITTNSYYSEQYIYNNYNV
jgi:hypothetical protein